MSFYLSNPEQEAKEYFHRYRWLYGSILLIFFIIIGRLWHLQIVQGQLLRTFSERNRIKETRIESPRGVILDRNGQVLVDNLPGFEITITPQYAKNLKETALVVGKILDLSASKIEKKVKNSKRRNGPFYPFRVKDNLTREEVFRLKLIRLDHPGLEVRETIQRHYPLKESGAQLFGYVGEITRKQLPILNKKRAEGTPKFEQGDILGKTGIEKTFDETLRGKSGVSFLEVDARGRELSKGNTSVSKVLGSIARFRPAVSGANLQLSIDKDIQQAAIKAFRDTDRIGSVVAVKPNGEIITWLNAPSFDPNQFSTGISAKLWKELSSNPYLPLRNKVIQDPKAPGSTFKPIVAIAGLQEGVITAKTTHHCSGSMRFGRRRYHCWSKEGHGRVNVIQALEQSCNIFFYKLGSALGIDRIAKYANLLGLGSKTGIPLLNENKGLVPTTEWKLKTRGEEWQPGENLSNAIGQSFVQATPLQMALAYIAIANRGVLPRPKLVRQVIDHQGQVIEDFTENIDKKTEAKLIRDDVFDTVIEGMRRVSNSPRGSARYWKIPGVQIAGKTGTTQIFSAAADKIYDECKDKPMKLRHHGWFVGFAPHDKPEIAVAVLSEHSCTSLSAAPVVKDIIQAYLEKYRPELIKKKKKKTKVRKVSAQ